MAQELSAAGQQRFEREGLTQLRELEGWTLVYTYPGKPTTFRIYRIDNPERSAANRPRPQHANGSLPRRADVTAHRYES
jgi:hypothetical protein